MPRELGAVLIPPTANETGAKLRVIIPRVHADRTVAQFRVQAAAVVGGRATLPGPRVGAGRDWGARPSSTPHSARARTHPTHTHGDAAQAPADSLLERFRSNTDLKHMMQFEAMLPVESSKAKRRELSFTRCQPLQPLLGPLQQCTSRTRTVACAASLDSLDKKAVLKVSLLADGHFSLEYTAPLSAFQALCVALALCAIARSQPPMPPP